MILGGLREEDVGDLLLRDALELFETVKLMQGKSKVPKFSGRR